MSWKCTGRTYEAKISWRVRFLSTEIEKQASFHILIEGQISEFFLFLLDQVIFIAASDKVVFSAKSHLLVFRQIFDDFFVKFRRLFDDKDQNLTFITKNDR